MRLKASFLGNGHVPRVADDDVIEKPDAEEIAGLPEPLGDRSILG